MSLTLNEFHPFSKFPMYNSFPNWSYAFYLSDEDTVIIPSSDYFNVTGGWMGHTFYSICQSRKIGYGYNIESDEELYLVGDQMMDLILDKNNGTKNFKQINLHKVDFKLRNDSVIENDKIIYERYFP